MRKVRVLYLLPSLATGGLERMVHLLATNLDRSRFDPRCQIFDKIGALKDLTEAEGVPVRFDKRGPGFLDRRFLRDFARRLAADPPDLIHAHNVTALVYGAFAAKLAGGIPVVYTEHDRSFPGRIPDRALHFAAGRLVDRVVVVAEWLKRALARWEGFDSSRIEVIPNGIEEERFSATIDRGVARMVLGIPQDAKVVSCVARLDPIKNHRALIAAFRHVATIWPEALLLLAGGGKEKERIEAEIARHDLGDRVRLLGELRDVPALLAASDLHALASHSEGMSLTLIETHAAGRPTVATSVGGNPEVVEDGRTGLLVPPGDVFGLATAITRLLQDRTLAETMGANARQRFLESFTLRAMIRRYELVYLRTLAERGRVMEAPSIAEDDAALGV